MCNICEPGTYTVSGSCNGLNDTQCYPCNGVTNYQNLANQYSCKPVSTCGIGTGQVYPPTPVSDSVCVACINGTYRSSLQQPACATCTVCPPGSQESVPPTTSADRQCESCIIGQTFKQTSGEDSVCVNTTVCQPGQYQTIAATTSSDRACVSCQVGYYTNSTASLFCTPDSHCSVGMFVSVQPTFTSDRECKVCPPNQYQNQIDMPSCTNFSICSPGYFQSNPPSSSNDRFCSECNGTTTYQDLSGQLSCKYTLNCTFNQYQSSAPTISSNRGCGAVTSCLNGQYQKLPPTATSNRVCWAYSQCLPGWIEQSPPTTTSDRVCALVFSVIYDIDYSQYAETPEQQANFTEALLDVLDMGAGGFNFTAKDVRIFSGSVIAAIYVYDTVTLHQLQVYIDNGVSYEYNGVLLQPKVYNSSPSTSGNK